MKDKEKQIEEMTKERIEIQDIMKLLGKCSSLNPMYRAEVATVIYGNNYRKLPEDSVVLTREEWNKLMGDTYTGKEVDEIVAYKERVKTKEVSRDILTKLADDFNGLVGMDVEYPLNKVKELARQFGVEVEE